MDFSAAQKKLQPLGQEHLLRYWRELQPTQQKHLLKQIEGINADIFSAQRRLVAQKGQPARVEDVTPLDHWDQSGNLSDVAAGRSQIAKGKVGCLVVAGGQGTRLGFAGPKGLFPVTVVRHKTLYRLLAEKVRAASIQNDCWLPFVVMTSPENGDLTKQYFEDNRNFGLKSAQIHFFVQGTLPFVGDAGELFLKDKADLAVGPDGNGCALHHFYHSGLWHEWRAAGVEVVSFIQVDNPLADPFDAELIGYHMRHGKDVTIKGTMRRDADEKVGVVVKNNDRIAVVEYTEMPKSEKIALGVDGELKYPVANMSNYCFSMSFIEKLCAAPLIDFPLHLAHKPVKVIGNDGRAHEIKAWKCERFIFDVLAYADDVAVIVYPRYVSYAPLKNASGPDSLQSVQNALLEYDRFVFQDVSGTAVLMEKPFELSPQFYYPTAELLERWKGAKLPEDSYVKE